MLCCALTAPRTGRHDIVAHDATAAAAAQRLCEAAARTFTRSQLVVAQLLTEVCLVRIKCIAVAGNGVSAEERSVRFEQQHSLHPSVGEKGIALNATDDVYGLSHTGFGVLTKCTLVAPTQQRCHGGDRKSWQDVFRSGHRAIRRPVGRAWLRQN